jgi:gliding motility-associated-like protein
MHYLMNRVLVFWLWLPVFSASTAQSPGSSGIRTSGGHSVESLVKDVFAKGACNNISNIRAIGNLGGIGFFENGSASISMDQGIIIATGPIKHAEGPNEAGDKSGNFNDRNGDPDLAKLSTHQILDAVGIEFDFVPLDSFVQFRYVFASEEYCEFVGSVYNDVFGFFVSGPGIEGSFSRNSKNVALIPGSNAYVSINSVNHIQNSSYFIRNDLEKDARQCGIDVLNSPYKSWIEYDGFTRILTAALQVIPCETYHIRFVVSDVADRHYDSAVFLEAGSFNIGGTVLVNAVGNQSGSSNAMEGCTPASFVFERGETKNLDKPLTVRFKIAEGSTAVENVDFASLPRTITIPAGQKSVQLPVQIFNDGIAESPEKLSIELDIPCACYSGTATLHITDAPALQVDLPPAFVCRSAPGSLQPTVSGGVPPYTYRWNNGMTSANIAITAGLTPLYTVTVSDQCSNVVVDSTNVTPIEPPGAHLNGTAQICNGDTAWLPVQLVGTPPWKLTYTIDGIIQPVFNVASRSPLGGTDAAYLPATKSGKYELLKVEDAGCAGAARGAATVAVTTIQIQNDLQHVRCANGSDGSISTQPRSGNAPFRYQWSKNSENKSTINNLQAGAYDLTVTDAQGCDQVFNFKITEPPLLTPITFDCKELTNPAFQFTARGGSPPYRYSTDGISFEDAAVFKNLEPGKTYNLTIRDVEHCTIQQTLTLPPVYEKMVELPPVLELKVGEIYQFVPKLNLSEQFLAKTEWQSGAHLTCTDCLNPQVEGLSSGVYTLQITDIFGCVGTASVNLQISHEVDVYIPTAFSPNGDRQNDFFTVYADEDQVQEVLSLLVFDRWGNQVFAARNFLPNDERVGWDGQINGDAADAAVFVYVAVLKLKDQTAVTKKGQVVLVR